MRPLVAVLGFLVLAGPVRAGGIDLSWNDCLIGSPLAATNRNFTCLGSTVQSYPLVFQFTPNADLPNLVALTAFADLNPDASGPLAPFWHYEVGGCNRTPQAGISISDVILPTCAQLGYQDPWFGGAESFETIAGYGADFNSPGRGRFVLLIYRAEGAPILAGIRYYGLHLTFNNRNRQSCFGCTQRALISWESVVLEGPNGESMTLSGPDQGTNCLGINGGNPSLCGVVPVRATTWGQLKSMYR